MSIIHEPELVGIRKMSRAVAQTLRECRLMPIQVGLQRNWMIMGHDLPLFNLWISGICMY